tara:strand:+ start:492 stop:722 length:231 start_codon:yes stop_codon:yes gene_type:complete
VAFACDAYAVLAAAIVLTNIAPQIGFAAVAIAIFSRRAESIFDFVQGMTAHARSKAHQDSRLDLEAKVRTLLENAE